MSEYSRKICAALIIWDEDGLSRLQSVQIATDAVLNHGHAVSTIPATASFSKPTTDVAGLHGGNCSELQSIFQQQAERVNGI